MCSPEVVTEAAPTLLTDADIHQAQLDALALWRKPMIEIIRSSLLIYNSLYPVDGELLAVYDYLCNRRNETASKEVK